MWSLPFFVSFFPIVPSQTFRYGCRLLLIGNVCCEIYNLFSFFFACSSHRRFSQFFFFVSRLILALFVCTFVIYSILPSFSFLISHDIDDIHMWEIWEYRNSTHRLDSTFNDPLPMRNSKKNSHTFLVCFLQFQFCCLFVVLFTMNWWNWWDRINIFCVWKNIKFLRTQEKLIFIQWNFNFAKGVTKDFVIIEINMQIWLTILQFSLCRTIFDDENGKNSFVGLND